MPRRTATWGCRCGVLVVLAWSLSLGWSATTGAAGWGPAEAPGRVEPTGSMAVPRAVHTATLLPTGRVLVAGGCATTGCDVDDRSATAELYDPASGAFGPTGSMATRRDGQTATLLPNGRVVLAGGWGRGGVLASAELFDPATGTFTPTGSMTGPRGGATATLLADGRVLVAGGEDDQRPLATAELYDPRTGSFAPTGHLTTPRMAHAAAPLPDGRVLIAGGSVAPGVILATAEIYDPATGTFTPTGAMAVPRHKLAAATLVDGRVLVVGGSDDRDAGGRYATVEVFDLRRGSFAAAGSMATQRYKLTDAVVRLPSGRVLVAGDGAQAEVFEPAADAFHPTAGGVDTGRRFATATVLPNGDALIVGGYDARIDVTARAWVFRPRG